jgi:proline iminopeptidase
MIRVAAFYTSVVLTCVSLPAFGAGQDPQPSADRAASLFRLRTFATTCGTLAYQEYGVGKPIVLLAGGPGMNPAYMAPVAKALSLFGRRAVLFDQRGTGKSASAISCRDRMTITGDIADLEDLRRHLGLDKLTIAGHSWGGMLAMAYAQSHPNRVAGLLLLDPGPMQSSAFPIEEDAILTRLNPAERTALKQAKDGAPVEKIERRALFAHPENAQLFDRSIPSGEPLWFESAGDLIGRDLKKFDVTQGMRTLNAPIAVIFGRQDPGLFTLEQIRHLHPAASTWVVDQAGHYPWLEQPVQTTGVLKDAVATLP